jgi:hypothetical protein
MVFTQPLSAGKSLLPPIAPNGRNGEKPTGADLPEEEEEEEESTRNSRQTHVLTFNIR